MENSVNKETLFSFIIPIYNVEKYLVECLESITNQTYTNIEIILVNDGSTDKSHEIILDYIKSDFRIKYIKQTNKGLSEARNAGLDIATGDFVLFIDSDDYVSRGLCEKASHILKKNKDIDIIQFGRFRFYNDGSFYEDAICINEKLKYSGIQWLKESISHHHFYSSSCNKIYKLSFLKQYNLRFIKGILYEDIYFVFKAAFYSQKLLLLPDQYYYYRFDRNDSIINTISEKDKDILVTVSKLEEFLRKEAPSELNEYYFNKLIFNKVSDAVCYKHISHAPASPIVHSIVKSVIYSDKYYKYVKYMATSRIAPAKYRLPAFLQLYAYPLYVLFVYFYFNIVNKH